MNFPEIDKKDLEFLLKCLDEYLRRGDDPEKIKKAVKIIDKLHITSAP